MLETLNDALKQTRRTPYQSIAAVMVIMLTFFFSAVFVLVSYASVRILRYFESTPQVIAFFPKGEDLDETKINAIRQELNATGFLASFKYVSTKEAEAIYKERNQDNPLLLELVDYKILPPSIEISAAAIDRLGSLKEILAKQEGVTDVVFFEDVVNGLSRWTKNIKYFGGGVLVFLLLQSVLIIFIIINIKITARREEVEVLRLIGATRGFIARPFLAEGVIYGFAGSLLAFIFSYGLVLYATPSLMYWLQEIPLLPLPWEFVAIFAAGQILGGVAVGLIGSLIAVSRQMR